jgi:hypothetical protein
VPSSDTRFNTHTLGHGALSQQGPEVIGIWSVRHAAQTSLGNSVHGQMNSGEKAIGRRGGSRTHRGRMRGSARQFHNSSEAQRRLSPTRHVASLPFHLRTASQVHQMHIFDAGSGHGG